MTPLHGPSAKALIAAVLLATGGLAAPAQAQNFSLQPLGAKSAAAVAPAKAKPPADPAVFAAFARNAQDALSKLELADREYLAIVRGALRRGSPPQAEYGLQRYDGAVVAALRDIGGAPGLTSCPATTRTAATRAREGLVKAAASRRRRITQARQMDRTLSIADYLAVAPPSADAASGAAIRADLAQATRGGCGGGGPKPKPRPVKKKAPYTIIHKSSADAGSGGKTYREPGY